MKQYPGKKMRTFEHQKQHHSRWQHKVLTFPFSVFTNLIDY